MLYVFGFERVGVVVSDLYFVDPDPGPGQEGAERGVRLELRLLERGESHGSIYSAQPITIGRPIWRADLLETVAGPPGSFDRTHHHPTFREWDPVSRVFDRDLSSDPLRWLAGKLADLEGVLDQSGVVREEVDAADAAALATCAPEIVGTVGRLLDQVREGKLGRPPSEEAVTSARTGWL